MVNAPTNAVATPRGGGIARGLPIGHARLDDAAGLGSHIGATATGAQNMVWPSGH